ncbi:hypothetical protein N7519_004226 [Penicillium mononematosum]|uniref:uncharacterized protein n=1 Tax=Penicillium mononematosum TaxID=268346 RepID=UPI002548242A|nr:uncharacterized protein N7519_004226 [Penicillium mononematosum]KAJ6189318.1 hypothetical protein N7519_004226 [Penicillium mononematosum]
MQLLHAPQLTHQKPSERQDCCWLLPIVNLSSPSDEMPTVFSKFADVEISSHDLQPTPVQGQDEKSESHTQLPSSDVYQVSRAELEQLKAILGEIVTERRLIDSQLEAIKQHPTVEGRVPELLNPPSIRAEMGPTEASRSPRADIDMTQSKSRNWTDKRAGLTLDNGQLRLRIEEWRTRAPIFRVENNTKGNPKCDLDAAIESPELVRVDFKIPIDYPEGMLGIMRSIEALFTSPKRIAMSNVETGSAPACREATNPKRHSYYMKWTAPWESSGCRVSWMKAKEKSSTLRFKFVSGRNANPGEQMMVTVDERDHFYRKISKNDPNTYGKWMALPVRIWLRIQCLVSETSGVDNGLFGKLLVDDVPPSSSKKKKNKGKKSSKKPAKRAREHSTAEEGRSEDEKPDASVVPSPGQSVLGEEHTMEKVGSQELTKELTEEELPQEELTQHELTEQEEESTREESTREESTKEESAHHKSPQEELTKRVSTLTIDTWKSNQRFKGKEKGKRTPSSSGSDTGKRDADHVPVHTTHNMTEQNDGLLPEMHDIAPQDVLTEQQLAGVAGQQTVNASRVPITPIDSTTPFSPSFETARTHISPRTPLPSSSFSSFFTPTTALQKIDEDHGEEAVQAEGNEPAKVSDELGLTPQGAEVGLRCPVSDNRGEVWFSDSEEYPGGHEAQEPVLRRSESFDVANLGLFEGQETTSSSQTADPPSTSCASSVLSTAESAGSATYDSSSSCTVLADDQTPAESSQHDKKRAYKKKKRERRKCKNLMKRQEARDADAEFPVSNASSKEDGVEGRSPSPPESFEDDEPTPTAMQFGNIGPPTPQSQWDLSMIGILCQKADCQVACGFGDGGSVVCPKCGPFSLVRYCGKDHLWEDAKMHWGGLREDPSLVPARGRLHQWDNPERHRQALWFSSARDRGDYFVFAEWDDLVRAEDAPASHLALRCSPRIAHIVRFEDAEEKDRFRRCLAICLFAAVEHPALVDYLYRLVRDWMRAHNMWASDKDMDSMLRYQMGLEMGGTIDASSLGSDLRERASPTLLGNHRMGLGFRRVCEALESNYWILRAHRATHPSVSDVDARTRGGGFSEVLAKDRRTFRRGVGWDGAGTGPMEVEIPWSG